MPVVIFSACLDLEQKPSFLDGHYLCEFEFDWMPFNPKGQQLLQGKEVFLCL